MTFLDELFLICSSRETICKKKALEMFSLCNLAHFPTQVVEGKKQKVGPNFPRKSEIGITLSPRIFGYTLKRKGV